MKSFSNSLSSSDRKSVNLIFLSVLLGLIYQSFQTLVPDSLAFIIILLSNLTGYCGCFIFITHHKLPKISRYFVLIVLYLFIVGSLYGSLFDKSTLTLALIQDFRYVMYFMSGCVFAYSDDLMGTFHRIMKVLAVFAAGAGIYALLFFDYSYISIETRDATWSLSYMLWWAGASCWVYWVYYALIEKKDKLYAIGAAGAYIILGILFLKREVVANIGIILLIYLYFNRKHIGAFLKTISIVVILFFIVYSVAPGLFGGVFDLMLNRFGEVDDMNEFDRSVESMNYFKEASLTQLLFGNGIGHFHTFHDSGLADSRGVLNALHLGYNNIIYKGGVVYALFNIMMFLRLLTKRKSSNIKPYMQVCLGCSFSYFISLSFAGSWTYTIAPFCVAAPLFYALNNEG